MVPPSPEASRHRDLVGTMLPEAAFQDFGHRCMGFRVQDTQTHTYTDWVGRQVTQMDIHT